MSEFKTAEEWAIEYGGGNSMIATYKQIQLNAAKRAVIKVAEKLTESSARDSIYAMANNLTIEELNNENTPKKTHLA